MSHEALQSCVALLRLLDRWVSGGWLRPLDRAFAVFLLREAEAAGESISPLLLLTAALLSHQNGRGHVCLDLSLVLDDPDGTLALPPENTQAWLSPLRPSVVLAGVTSEQWHAALLQLLLVGNGQGNTPLVQDDTRVYLRRYWQYEQDIATAITRRTVQVAALPDAALLREILDALFVGNRKNTEPDWQKIACALAVRSAFSVITGGPGTGKTTTVVRLLAALQSLALQENGSALRIRLAAPTGKAAARLNASITGQIEQLRHHSGQPAVVCDAIVAEGVCTLHRLLGSLPDSRHFRHHAGNPLPVDVVVVDEASMIDVEMMARLLDAMPPHARLVLLGDKDQLASVEAGAVLGQLCLHAAEARYSAATAGWLATVTGEQVAAPYVSDNGHAIDQSIAMLRYSHRFGEHSGIGRLARAVNAGDVAAARSCLAASSGDIVHLRLHGTSNDGLDELLVNGYRDYLQCARDIPPCNDRQVLDRWALEVLQAHGCFQLLCALRAGEAGVENLNRRTSDCLQRAGLIDARREWYAGRPVIVMRNDYSLGLMNGDIGIVLPHPAGLRVAFPAGDGTVRWILPARLADVETVFAMTVHKAQGSEFGHAVLLLPEQASPVLTRELLYTAITRAAERFTLVDHSDESLSVCIARRVQRVSGMLVHDRLY